MGNLALVRTFPRILHCTFQCFVWSSQYLTDLENVEENLNVEISYSKTLPERSQDKSGDDDEEERREDEVDGEEAK